MPNAQYGLSFSVGGVSISKSAIITGDHPNTYEVTLPVAWALSSWVKTDANTAAGNLTGGHGQTNGTYDVYWTGGKRIGVTVTISTNAVSLDGGAGDDFPASADTTVKICKQVVINTAIDGDAIQAIAVSLEYADPNATSVGYVDMLSSAPATIEALNLAANVPQFWNIAAGATNVFTGDPIVSSKASHSNTSYAATLKILSMEDSTP